MPSLTENFVQALKVPEGKLDIQVFDEKLPGFGVRKYAKGHAVYIVKYSVNGRPKKATLGPVVEGNLKTMRLAADEYLRDARAGKDRRAEAKDAFYGWAIDMNHHAGANPTADIKQYDETGRDRVLSEPDLVVMLQNLPNDDFGRCMWLLALTGCRREEIGGLRWAEINWDMRQIELPKER